MNSKDAKIAKNYLQEIELKKLSLLVEQFLSFAELKSIEKEFMYMRDWINKIDEFIILNDKKILKNSGSISYLKMEQKVRQELKFYISKDGYCDILDTEDIWGNDLKNRDNKKITLCKKDDPRM